MKSIRAIREIVNEKLENESFIHAIKSGNISKFNVNKYIKEIENLPEIDDEYVKSSDLSSIISLLFLCHHWREWHCNDKNSEYSKNINKLYETISISLI